MGDASVCSIEGAGGDWDTWPAHLKESDASPMVSPFQVWSLAYQVGGLSHLASSTLLCPQ